LRFGIYRFLFNDTWHCFVAGGRCSYSLNSTSCSRLNKYAAHPGILISKMTEPQAPLVNRRVLPLWMTARPAQTEGPAGDHSPPNDPSPSLHRLIERTEFVLAFLEDVLAPPQLEWNLYDYAGQEEELKEAVATGAFELEESDLMQHFTVDEVLEPIRLFGPPDDTEHRAKRTRSGFFSYSHDAPALHAALSLALRAMLLLAAGGDKTCV
jgi:hypothetical protein